MEDLLRANFVTSTLIVATTAFFVGYFLGSRNFAAQKRDSFNDDDWEDLSEQEDEGIDVYNDDYKMVLVVRTDLGMTKGKVAAQCSHATLACYREATRKCPKILRAWERSGQAKVTLKVESEQAMLDLQSKARQLGLCAQSIRDAGRTQIAAGSRTVLAVGPGPISAIDRVTGNLKLY
ncbi:uncharacterized protein VTP21DRAFT_2934 [Calcarisporiella thermophila]|uniref:uncharacterized protein n=1 Tax=Calcarisporiella thermophila TaxID=911321 RepID=UPI0037429453